MPPGRQYRPYQSQQPLGPLGSDVQFGVRQGVNAITPGVGQGLQQAGNSTAPGDFIRQQAGSNDALRQLILRGMASRGYSFNPAQTQYEMDRMFGSKT
jgi:hypothetical protein